MRPVQMVAAAAPTIYSAPVGRLESRMEGRVTSEGSPRDRWPSVVDLVSEEEEAVLDVSRSDRLVPDENALS